MASKIKNIIIFVVIAIALILIYVFFFKKAPEEANLAVTSEDSALPSASVADQNTAIGEDFLSLLLSVKSIKLDDSIFADTAFATLRDSSIELIADGTEGRPNPFAPIGIDVLPTTGNTQTGILTPTNGLGILGTIGASTDEGCALKLSAMELDPLLNVTLAKGVSSQITALGFKGLENKISWIVKDTKIATVSPSTGKTAQLKSVGLGSTQLTVTDNAIVDCSVSIPVTIN